MILLKINLNSSRYFQYILLRCQDWGDIFFFSRSPHFETEEHLVTFESNLNALDSFNVACLYVVSSGNAI